MFYFLSFLTINKLHEGNAFGMFYITQVPTIMNERMNKRMINERTNSD